MPEDALTLIFGQEMIAIAVLTGAFLSIGLTCFFELRSQSTHFWMTLFLAVLLGPAEARVLTPGIPAF
jgi:hypothetical protein